MTIEKGKPWGVAGTVPDAVFVARTDAEAATAMGRPVQLVGGNLWESLGSPASRVTGSDCTFLTVDGLVCSVNHRGEIITVSAISEVVVGSWTSRQGLIVVSNAGMWGGLNIAPRAHPNDGEFDVFSMESTTTVRQRLLARRRAVTGTHLPHPSMSVRRSTHVVLERNAGESLVIDGVTFGHWTSVSVAVKADFYSVVV